MPNNGSDFDQKPESIRGNNKIGDEFEDLQQFTGSVYISGSLFENDIQITGPMITDVDAIHIVSGSEISLVTEKTSLVSTDLFLIEDASASFAKKKITANSFRQGDPFVNRFDAVWNYSVYKWEFYGDIAHDDFNDWSPFEPLGDAGSWSVEDEIGGAPRVYVNDTAVGRYIEVDSANVFQLGYGSRTAMRVARRNHIGSPVSQRFEVFFQFSNASAYNANFAGFRANANGNWQAISIDNSIVSKSTDTGVASADENYHWLEWLIETSSVTYWIDGTQVAIHSTSLPVGIYGHSMMRGEILESGTGNQDKNFIDAIMIKTPRTGTIS